MSEQPRTRSRREEDVSLREALKTIGDALAQTPRAVVMISSAVAILASAGAWIGAQASAPRRIAQVEQEMHASDSLTLHRIDSVATRVNALAGAVLQGSQERAELREEMQSMRLDVRTLLEIQCEPIQTVALRRRCVDRGIK